MKRWMWVLCMVPLIGYGFGKNKVIYYSYDWRVAFSQHFVLYVPVGLTNEQGEVLAMLEEAYAHHERLFDHSLQKPVQVILYPNQIDFLKNNIIPWTERGTEGFTELSRGRVVLYYTPRSMEMRHYVFHELAHVFQFSLWSDPRRGGMPLMSVPLLVVEGAAEWASVKATREGDRYVANLLYRGKLPTLKELNNPSQLRSYQYYLIYKMGALFYAFAEEKWGEDFFHGLMHKLAEKRNWTRVLEQDFGMQEERLSREFQDFLSRRYFPRYPVDKTPRKIHEKEDFEAHIVWVSTNEFITMGVDRYYPVYLLYNTTTGTRKVLDRMGITENNLYFQYQKNHLSKSTGGKVCWLIEGGDRYRLVIYEAKTGKKTIHTLPYRVFFSPDISPSGEEVVVVALEGQYHLLAVYDLRTKKTTVLFKTLFVMDTPRWYDEDRVMVAANFAHGVKSENMDLYLYNRRTGKWEWRMDSGESDEMPFVVAGEGETSVLFVRQGLFPALCLFDPGKRRVVSLYQAPGEMSFPVCEGDRTYVTLYDGGTMAVYEVPESEGEAVEVTIEDSPALLESGERELVRPLREKPYGWNLAPDMFLFLMSVNSYGDLGVAGLFSGSDVLGDHQAYAMVDSLFVGANPRLAGWNFEMGYFFLKYRHQLGARVLHYNNLLYEWIQFPDFYQVGYAYFDKWQADVWYAYPLSTFQRWEATISYRSANYPFVSGSQVVLSNAQNVKVSGGYVFDNTLESGMGPLDGIRMAFLADTLLPLNGLGGFATRLIGDVRGYAMIVPGYGFATRLAGGTMVNYEEHRPQEYFFVGGHNSLRGYPYGEFRADTALVWNTEFRFPLIPFWVLGFPPIQLPPVWGIGFVDVGSSFFREEISRWRLLAEDGRFQDVRMSCGLGLRLVLSGDIKLMWNIAYPYDGKTFAPVVHEVVITRDF